MTANPIRGEVWQIRFDPAEGDEIRKVRTAVVISEDAIGRLWLKSVVPITEWKPRYASFPWFVQLSPTATNGLTKDSGADAIQVKSVSEARFLDRLGELTPGQLDDIANAIAICVGVPEMPLKMANIGVLNLDEYGEIGNRSAETDFPLIHGLVRRGLTRFGELALFWNQDLDSVSRRRQNRGEALRRHADMVSSVLQDCLPRRELTSAMLLPEGSEPDIDGVYIGVVGAFEIYRGSARGHRMANLRVILR